MILIDKKKYNSINNSLYYRYDQFIHIYNLFFVIEKRRNKKKKTKRQMNRKERKGKKENKIYTHAVLHAGIQIQMLLRLLLIHPINSITISIIVITIFFALYFIVFIYMNNTTSLWILCFQYLSCPSISYYFLS